MRVLKVALIDMAGTTVADEVDGRPFVFAAFERAFAEVGLAVGPHELAPLRGLDKRRVIETFLEREGAVSQAQVDSVLASFEAECRELLPRLRPMPGAREAIEFLQGRGVFVALGTGLPQTLAESMAEAVGLVAQHVTSGERAGGGRPGRQMADDAVRAAGFDASFDFAELLKVGDTPTDVAEGLGVGAYTVAVASGSFDEETLGSAGAHAVLGSVAELPELLSRP